MVKKLNFQTKESKEKAKFRQTAVWKKFRQLLRKKRKVDFITGKPLYKGFQLHHLDMHLDNYKDLNEDNYLTLNKSSHELLHWGFRYNDWEFLLIRIAHAWLEMDRLNGRTEKTPKQIELDKLFADLYVKLEERQPELFD